MPVHTIMFEFFYHIRLTDLFLHFQIRTAFYHHIPTEFTCQNYQCSVEVTGSIKVFNQLCHRCVNHFFHIDQSGMPVFMGVPVHEWFVFGGNTDKPCPLFNQAFCHQTSQSEPAGIVNIIRLFFLPAQVKCFSFRRFEQHIGLLHGAFQGFFLIFRPQFTRCTLSD